MSYLKFDKTLMTNLQTSLYKELLFTNKSGAYCSTTLLGCNIRKYHGLLVVPVPEMDDENHVLLSALDETVVQHGAEFNLGIHKYQGENYQYAINGQTGKVVGNYPVDQKKRKKHFRKVFLLSFLPIAAIASIVGYFLA